MAEASLDEIGPALFHRIADEVFGQLPADMDGFKLYLQVADFVKDQSGVNFPDTARSFGTFMNHASGGVINTEGLWKKSSLSAFRDSGSSLYIHAMHDNGRRECKRAVDKAVAKAEHLFARKEEAKRSKYQRDGMSGKTLEDAMTQWRVGEFEEKMRSTLLDVRSKLPGIRKRMIDAGVPPDMCDEGVWRRSYDDARERSGGLAA